MCKIQCRDDEYNFIQIITNKMSIRNNRRISYGIFGVEIASRRHVFYFLLTKKLQVQYGVD